MKSLIFLINFCAVTIIAFHGFALFAGLETDRSSTFVSLALICIAQALKEISKRLDKIEETKSKENESPALDQ